MDVLKGVRCSIISFRRLIWRRLYCRWLRSLRYLEGGVVIWDGMGGWRGNGFGYFGTSDE